MIAFAQLYWPGYAYVRSYYPNFLILTKNGNWLVVEVKVRNRMDDRDVLAKRMSGIHLAIPVFSKGYRPKQGKVAP